MRRAPQKARPAPNAFRHGGLHCRRGFCLRCVADSKRVDPDRLGDVLELGLAEIGSRQIVPPPHLPKRLLGETDAARLANTFEPSGDVDAVAHQVAVASSTTLST